MGAIMNGKFNWYAVGQTIVGGLGLAGILFAFSISSRLTLVEHDVMEEQKGYSIVLGEMSKRLDRMESKIDLLLQKAHTHGGN